MRLKMSDRSLFAILLRSPWWGSVLVALAVVAVARLVLPESLWIYGASGGLPFVVIAALAARRQWREPGEQATQATVEACRAMSRLAFADLIARILQRDGHSVEPLRGSPAEFLVEKAGRRTLVCCQRWKAARNGVESIRELQVEVERRDAHDALFIATGDITDAARTLAARNGIRLVQGAELARMLKGHLAKPTKGAAHLGLLLHAAGALALGACLLSPAPAGAQAWPSKPIHLVVPYAPGGAVDTVARIVGARLSERLGQGVVVENRPGASTNIGMQAVAKSPADGYTLLMASPSLATNVALFPTLPFDPSRDFVAVSKIGYAPLVVVVPQASPYATMQQLLAAARAQPGKLIYGSAGNGSSGHLAGELLEASAGISTLHVPYKGGAQALTDLIGERLTFMPINPIEVLAHIRSQRLRALAVASARRFPLLPSVPTVSEAGVPGFEAAVWWGIVAPTGTPAEVVDRLNAATQQALAEPATRDRLSDIGVVIDSGSAAQFGDYLKQETVRWTRVIQAAKIQPD